MGQLRWAARIAVLVAAAVAAGSSLAGCGGIGGGGAAAADQAQTLTIYSSLPLQGPDQARQTSIVDGEKLALAEAGGRVGPFHVSFASLTDSNPRAGSWTPDDTLQAARTASSDRSTIAYLGDWDSPASAISLPLLNESGILQVSPASTYVGLTEASPTDGRGEPDRYYPSAGPRTFARLAPSDVVEAQAMVAYMSELGVRRLFVIGDYDVFNADIAGIVATLAPERGIAVVGHARIDTRSTQARPADFTQRVAGVAVTRADAVIVGGTAGAGVEALWQALHAGAPRAKLFAASSLATPAFAAAAGRTGSATYVTSPVLEATAYPAAAQRMLRRYRAAFGIDGTPYSLYGYEAMKYTLDAIRAAGSHGGDRASVVRAFFGMGPRDSVLGRYAITPSGDTDLTNMAGYRVGSDGRLRFDRLLRAG
ncbi:MAG: branched-chain amino acid transport system substrate-binding protein [Solirubrobacteraceae bacterium]|nr:branched-chain amino acid transport system substrate-binding protein [Solirubrobacteraceae bacterium]